MFPHKDVESQSFTRYDEEGIDHQSLEHVEDSGHPPRKLHRLGKLVPLSVIAPFFFWKEISTTESFVFGNISGLWAT